MLPDSEREVIFCNATYAICIYPAQLECLLYCYVIAMLSMSFLFIWRSETFKKSYNGDWFTHSFIYLMFIYQPSFVTLTNEF